MYNDARTDGILRNLLTPAAVEAQTQLVGVLNKGGMPKGWTIYGWFGWALHEVLQAGRDCHKLLDENPNTGCRVERYNGTFFVAFAKTTPAQPVLAKRIDDAVKLAGWRLAYQGDDESVIYYYLLPLGN